MSESLDIVSHHSLTFGQKLIPFQLTFRPKLRLSITVLPNRQVMVSAPEGQALEKILELVKKRAGWIAKKRNYFEQFHPLPDEKRFISGESHLYLGRQYRLKLQDSEVSGVKLVGKYFQISVKEVDLEKVKATLDAWYMKRAEKLFIDKVEGFLKSLPSLRLKPKKITIRRMTKRWGSCTKAGSILLNIDLIKAPLHCIEYVIAHELCHLRVHDHSPAFYRLLSRLMPYWKKRKARLDSFIL